MTFLCYKTNYDALLDIFHKEKAICAGVPIKDGKFWNVCLFLPPLIRRKVRGLSELLFLCLLQHFSDILILGRF